MTVDTYSSFSELYRDGHFGPQAHTMKSPGGLVDLLEVRGPAGDVSRPAIPDIVLYLDMAGGSRLTGDLGGGRFSVMSNQGNMCLAAPNFAVTNFADAESRVRSLAFPTAQWQGVLDEAADGQFLFDSALLYGEMFDSVPVRTLLTRMWSICESEGGASRLLARAAGCEILAELYKLGGHSFAPAKGGLAPWAERRCIEFMHARLAEDLSLDELAGEAGLSAFHFARMFKESVGLPPRVYLTRLRIEKACELLEHTDLPVTQIAFEVGYSSNQVLARVFHKHQRMSPTDYRRAVRDPKRSVVLA